MELMENAKGAAISQKTLSLAIEKTGKASKLASVGMKALSVAGNMLVSFLATWAISFAIQQIDDLVHAFDRQAEKLEETKSAYEDSKKAVSDVETELSNVKERLEELNKIDNPTFVQQEEIDNLKEVTKELESQLAAKQAIAEIDASKVEQDFVKTVDKYSEGNIFATSQKKKNETDFDTHRFYVDEANFYRQQLADELAKESELRDGKKIEKLQENISLYTGLATDVIKRISDSYKTLTDAGKDIPVNAVTRDSFKVIDDLGLQIAEAQAYGGSGSILADSFDILWNSPVYAEGTKKLQELAEEGKLVVDSLSSDPDISSFLEACEQINIKASDVIAHINKQFSEIGEDDATGKSHTESLSSLNAKLIESSAAYTKLNEAIEEFNNNGVLSIETYTALIGENEKYAELLTLTAEGYVFNTEALHEYIEAQNELIKGEALLAAERLQEQLESLADTEENAAERASLERQIQEMYAMAEATENATSALQEFRIAQSTPNKGEDHGTGKEAGEVITEALTETGKVGTDEFEKAMNFMVGEGWESDKDASYKKAQENIKRYFGEDDKTNVKNFAKDLESAGFGSFDGEVFTMDEVVNIEEAANALGLTEEATESLFKLMQDHGADLTWDFGDLSKEEKALVETTKALEENNQKLSEKKEYQAELQKLEDEGVETVTLDDGSVVSVKDELANVEQEIEETEAAGETLKETLNDLKVDPEKMTPEELVAKIQEVYDAISTFAQNGIPVDLSLGATYNSLVAFLQTKHGITVDVDDNGSITFTKEELDNGLPDEEPVDVNVDDNGTASGTGEAIKEAASGPEGGYQASIGVEANADDLTTTDEQLDNVAEKERTADIKVRYVDSSGNELDGPIQPPTTPTVEYTDPSTGERVSVDYQTDLEKGGKLLVDARNSGTTGIDSQINSFMAATDTLYSALDTVKNVDPSNKDANVEAVNNLTAAYQAYLDAYNELETVLSGGSETMPTTSNVEDNKKGILERMWEGVENFFGGSANAEEATAYMGVEVDPDSKDNLISDVQDTVESTPATVNVDAETSSIEEQIVEATPEEVVTTVNAEVGETPVIGDSTSTVTVGMDGSAAESEAANLESELESGAVKPLSLDTTQAETQHDTLLGKLTAGAKKVIQVVYTGIKEAFATGTKSAPGGPSIVDDGTGANAGPELILHNKQGTYEIGSGNGPRVTNLDKGDTVFTARQTKSILSRAAKVGGFFRDGLNNTIAKGKAIIGKAFASGVSGSMNFGLINSILSGGGSSKKNTSSSAKKSSEGWKKYVEKLFDWIEIRLERLQTQTDKWILAASEAIGYVAKNAELDKALSSTSQQIDETTQAYQRYIEQADMVAKKSKLSAEIIQKIQDGTIDIASYKDSTKEKIQAYQEWYDKAMDCVEAVTELREQERDLASQKLDSILDHYQWRIDRLDAVVSSNDAMLGLKAATGVRVEESDYDKAIDATTQKIQELTDSRSALSEEFADMVSRGYIVEGSELWYQYTGELESLDETIIETKTDLQELIDDAKNIALTNLQYAMSALENSAATINQMMGLHESQGADHSATDYEKLIHNGMAQIKNLEAQNAELLKQQETLDPLSEKYQELQEQIDSNNQSILDMKTSQEQWNDAVVDLKISELEKYKDTLSKANDEYQRQKDLQQAIEDLERARTQRTQRVYREGVGFVFEQDQDALLEAQTNLESVVQDQLIDKIDDLIEAIQESKADTNVYDANGVLLGQEYVLPDIGSYSDLLNGSGKNKDVITSAMEDAKKTAYEQILRGVLNNNQTSVQIGDINIQSADNPEDLAYAIIDNLPNAILQELYSKT